MHDVSQLNRLSDWRNIRVGVVGFGVAGFAAADALLQLDAQVTVIDGASRDKYADKAQLLEVLGATFQFNDDRSLPDNLDLLVLSPGVSPAAPIVNKAQERRLPIWGELELAWRLRDPENPAPWLVITGTNGKTTTTKMLEAILAEKFGAKNVIAAGNIGIPMCEVVMNPTPITAIAVEVGAPQLPFVYSMSPVASVCLNLAEDHIDLFGSFTDYRDAKARIYNRTQIAAIYNEQDIATERMVEQADVVEGCRAVAFTVSIPHRSMVGLVDDILADRAFLEERESTAIPIIDLGELPSQAPHNVQNALAAIALARAIDVEPAFIKAGLMKWQPAPHRITQVARINGVDYVDDSKATNTHAAFTSIRAYESVIWIAGGLAKGQNFDELVEKSASRLRGVVLLGTDQDLIAESLAKYSPEVPVKRVLSTEISAMKSVVHAAAELASSGDTVLLAPGCASWDMFTDYAQRGDAFAQAVRELGNS
ncbi:MAG: UDP-N-acetylmuramoyl-L-alanine--D-glutamate ligase [Actinomycetales bacterium]|nr:UDP-N-acetylmuramoyl-L-alanine--D-glutamate ligase [Actinomycetales bacterium]